MKNSFIWLSLALMFSINHVSFCKNEIQKYDGEQNNGRVSYTYYENEKGDIILEGNYVYIDKNIKLSGFFKNGMRDSIWIFEKMKLPENIVEMKCSLTYKEGNYSGPFSIEYFSDFTRKGHNSGKELWGMIKNNIISGEIKYIEISKNDTIELYKGSLDQYSCFNGEWIIQNASIIDRIWFSNGIPISSIENNYRYYKDWFIEKIIPSNVSDLDLTKISKKDSTFRKDNYCDLGLYVELDKLTYDEPLPENQILINYSWIQTQKDFIRNLDYFSNKIKFELSNNINKFSELPFLKFRKFVINDSKLCNVAIWTSYEFNFMTNENHLKLAKMGNDKYNYTDYFNSNKVIEQKYDSTIKNINTLTSKYKKIVGNSPDILSKYRSEMKFRIERGNILLIINNGNTYFKNGSQTEIKNAWFGDFACYNPFLFEIYNNTNRMYYLRNQKYSFSRSLPPSKIEYYIDDRTESPKLKNISNLKPWIENGSLTKSTYVWKDGQTRQLAGNVPEFKLLFEEIPTPDYFGIDDELYYEVVIQNAKYGWEYMYFNRQTNLLSIKIIAYSDQLFICKFFDYKMINGISLPTKCLNTILIKDTKSEASKYLLFNNIRWSFSNLEEYIYNNKGIVVSSVYEIDYKFNEPISNSEFEINNGEKK